MAAPFRFLGFTHNGARDPKYIFYFISDYFGGGRIVIQKSEMDKKKSTALHNIAPPDFWRAVFPDGKGGVEWIRAKDWITTKSFRTGIYVPPSDVPKVYKDLTARNAPRNGV